MKNKTFFMEQEKNKILVTGGMGFVGSILVPLLLEKGNFVRVVDNLMFNQFTLAACFLNNNFEFLKGDIRDRKLMSRALKDIDFIIHLAAIVGEPACQKDPKLCYSVNSQGTDLINELRDADQKIIFASTGCVYGKVEGVCTENSPFNPLSSNYSISKREGEKIIEEKGNYITYRFATGFGLSPRLKFDLMIHDFIYQAIKNKALVVYEGDAKRSFIHVWDMARALVFTLDNFQTMKNQAYNVGSEKLNITKKEIAQKIKEKIDYCLGFADFNRDPEQRNYEVSYAKIREKGFEVTVDIDKGITELIQGFRVLNINNISRH